MRASRTASPSIVGTFRLLRLWVLRNTRDCTVGGDLPEGESADVQRFDHGNCHLMPAHSCTRSDAKTLFHPLWSNSGDGGGAGGRNKASFGRIRTCALSCAVPRQMCTSGLTSILHLTSMQNTAHAYTTRIVSEEQRDQAGASCAGVRLQPPASFADPAGAYGSDAALYRGDRGGMPSTFRRERPRL